MIIYVSIGLWPFVSLQTVDQFLPWRCWQCYLKNLAGQLLAEFFSSWICLELRGFRAVGMLTDPPHLLGRWPTSLGSTHFENFIYYVLSFLTAIFSKVWPIKLQKLYFFWASNRKANYINDIRQPKRYGIYMRWFVFLQAERKYIECLDILQGRRVRPSKLGDSCEFLGHLNHQIVHGQRQQCPPRIFSVQVAFLISNYWLLISCITLIVFSLIDLYL